MPYRIAAHHLDAHHLDAQRSASPDDLRRVFEAAVGDIHQADMASRKRLQYRAPIVPRARILGLSQAGAEKQALSDAARALAQLWKL